MGYEVHFQIDQPFSSFSLKRSSVIDAVKQVFYVKVLIIWELSAESRIRNSSSAC